MKQPTQTSKFQRWLLPTLIILFIFAIIFTAVRDNIRVVIPHIAYRSAQLSPTALKMVAHFKHIKSIINLRGTNWNEKWYQREITTAQKLGIQHYDIALSSNNLPSKAKLEKLVRLIKTAPKPVLLHCESGNDRSGLASAMALILLKNDSLAQASKQFSWRYFVFSNNSVGKLVFNHYPNWLKKIQGGSVS